MWHTGEGMGWWMLWGGLMMVFFWGAIIVLVAWAVQALARRDAQGPPREGTSTGLRPLDILKERYARGEIDRDEFEQMRRDLEGT